MMESLPLGKHQDFPEHYDPKQLCRIPRALGRENLAITQLPFQGYDLWRVYELSWLDQSGKPCVAALEIIIPADSGYLVESKSLKLYLGSLNQTCFSSTENLLKTIEQDLTDLLVCSVELKLLLMTQALWPSAEKSEWGIVIDDQIASQDQKIERWHYDYAPELLSLESGERVKERLVSYLLRSVCPVTGQPDWATLVIEYCGAAISHEALLRYIVSFRNHAEFHEQCVERIFVDLIQRCQPEELSVYAAYTRRGGIEINPFRSNCKKLFELGRAERQ